MPLTPEELLSPRRKVIAAYPGNKDFPVGKIVTFEPFGGAYWQHVVRDCQGERIYTPVFFDEYPHLFAALPWHIGRQISDMPAYVMWTHGDGYIAKVLSWRECGAGRFECRTQDEAGNYRWDNPGESDLLPATKEHFDMYQAGFGKEETEDKARFSRAWSSGEGFI